MRNWITLVEQATLPFEISDDFCTKVHEYLDEHLGDWSDDYADPEVMRAALAQHGIHLAKSSYETEIGDFISSISDLRVIKNTRSILPNGMELDFYIPSKNLAIEFNGLYWHSDIFKNDGYHREKYNECQEIGIRLLMDHRLS